MKLPRVERAAAFDGPTWWLHWSAGTFACRHPGGGFFRVAGYGLSLNDHRRAGPLFSERNTGRYGIPRRLYVHFGPWCLSTLRPLPKKPSKHHLPPGAFRV